MTPPLPTSNEYSPWDLDILSRLSYNRPAHTPHHNLRSFDSASTAIHRTSGSRILPPIRLVATRSPALVRAPMVFGPTCKHGRIQLPSVPVLPAGGPRLESPNSRLFVCATWPPGPRFAQQHPAGRAATETAKRQRRCYSSSFPSHHPSPATVLGPS